MTLPGFPEPSERRTVRNRARSHRAAEAEGVDAYDDFTGSRRVPESRGDDASRATRTTRDRDDPRDGSSRPTERIRAADPARPVHRPPHGRPPPSPLPERRTVVVAHDDGEPDRPTRRSADRPPTVTRVAANRARTLSRTTVRRIGDASRAGGAGESGLTRVIWMNVVQTGGDAMIAVALANTIFFSAATSQQKSNVALYLVITMAPFALVAPLIGPLLDRMQRGRRIALAGTMVIRGVLAWIMAANFHNVGLYPAVFGFLVVSKAFNVLKGAVVPRVLPNPMTLVTANARLSIFGLAGGALFGGIGGSVIKLTGSSAWTLRLALLVFIAAAVLSVKLPQHVDSAEGEVQADVLRAGGDSDGTKKSRRALGVAVVTALRGASALRGLSGFLTLFLAFLIQHEYHGWHAAVALGALAVAAGGGGFLGTASGAHFKLGRPEVIVLTCVSVATTACVVGAVTYSIEIAVATVLVAGISNTLAKLSLDAIIQRDVPDWLRASAFGRSETLLQLAWVLGGALGISLPPNGRVGFGVVAGVLAAALAATIVQSHRGSGHAPGRRLSRVPGGGQEQPAGRAPLADTGPAD